VAALLIAVALRLFQALRRALGALRRRIARLARRLRGASGVGCGVAGLVAL
jgi:hypothetical protein